MEIELKLALPTDDPDSLVHRLARIPLLARRKPVRQEMYNIYYDTPEQSLRQQQVALRLRRVGGTAAPQWLQTLKIGGSDESALSQRGEWETSVPGAQLDAQALAGTPWSDVDPQGVIFPALAPCFTTEFTRTRWTVRNRNGSAVEVALDIGHIAVDDHCAPICELELELLAGDAGALFRIGQQIAQTVATLPLGQSKAQRGYALGRNTLHAPEQAHPPELTADQPVAQAALVVLRETLSHCTANLVGLMQSDDPELVHQARIGWRRFKTSLKLFRKLAGATAPTEMQALQPMLSILGSLRDLEVASLQTLPMLANAYTEGDPARQAHWRSMEQTLAHATTQERDALHVALCQPHVGATLLATIRWLETDMAELANEALPGPKNNLQDWARDHIKKWHTQLKQALAVAQQNPENAHRARILAKRLRYGIVALRPLLPRRRSKHWYLQASRLQNDMGSARDVLQALALATQLEVEPGLLNFLRGYASGKAPGP